MKVYSIGREIGCDIVIDDNSDVISRRHATLNVTSSGKMTIVDLSHNGTYVNGIRINQNVPVPVTRKDNISFAHVARLDWDQIPNSGTTVLTYVALAVLALLLVGGGVFGYFYYYNPMKHATEPVPAVVDSASVKEKQQKIKEEEQQKADSIKKHVQDSLNKVRQQQQGKKKVEQKKKDTGKKKPDEKKKEETTTQRRIKG